MYHIKRVPSIKIDLDPGLYVFDAVSGSGKSYLAFLLNMYSISEPVISITYSDIKKGFVLSRLIDKPFDVLMLDRYNMYEKNDDVLERICRAHPNSYILVDSKLELYADVWYEIVNVDFSETEITVCCSC